ncbi:NAD-dependent epimerase/dehydratase family protein [Paenibacillus larvae]
MKILITGAEGQLGREAVQLMKSRGHEVHGMGKGIWMWQIPVRA